MLKGLLGGTRLNTWMALLAMGLRNNVFADSDTECNLILTGKSAFYLCLSDLDGHRQLRFSWSFYGDFDLSEIFWTLLTAAIGILARSSTSVQVSRCLLDSSKLDEAVLHLRLLRLLHRVCHGLQGHLVSGRRKTQLILVSITGVSSRIQVCWLGWCKQCSVDWLKVVSQDEFVVFEEQSWFLIGLRLGFYWI